MTLQFRSLLKKWVATSLILRIFVGLVIGAVLALLAPDWTWIGVFGKLFVGALKAIAPVLVAMLVISSIAKANGGLGSRFGTVIALYLISTLSAALVAVAGSFLFPVTLQLQDVVEASAPAALSDVFGNLLANLVTNPITSLASANYIGILFWSILVGLGLKIAATHNTIQVVSDLADVVSLIVRWIIQFAPFGIMGLVFSAVSESGLEIFSTYGRLILVLVGCMLFNTLVMNPVWSFLATGRNPYPLLLTCLKESGLQAFFTRSSAANIPINMALCKKLELDKDFYSVSIPLGATINMNGAAVTITVMTLAVAHTLGIEVSFLSAVFLSVVATLGACGASGVAGGSLLLIPMACSFLGIGNDIAMQAVAVGFIIGVVQDSVETALNSSGDVFFTATAEYREWRRLNGKS
ncbi:MAG: serine/threonine transporter SstT [Bacteroidales bacterium]|nr:serine/threonine transporter SstT [Bacteroidales bacterium]